MVNLMTGGVIWYSVWGQQHVQLMQMDEVCYKHQPHGQRKIIFRISGQNGQCCGQHLNHECPELYHTHYCLDSFPVKCSTLDCDQRTIKNTYITTELIRIQNSKHSSMKTAYTKISTVRGKWVIYGKSSSLRLNQFKTLSFIIFPTLNYCTSLWISQSLIN